MKWFMATMVYQVLAGDGKLSSKFEEQVRLVVAPDAGAALQKANAFGMAEQFTLPHLVQWKFAGVIDLFQLHHYFDGAAVYSNIVTADSGAEYLAAIDRKAQALCHQPTKVPHF